MFQNTLMSTSDAVVVFDAGAGQVGCPDATPMTIRLTPSRHKAVEKRRKTGTPSCFRNNFPV